MTRRTPLSQRSRYRTSANCTRRSQRERSNALSRPITGRRAASFVQPLKAQLDRLREDDPSTPASRTFSYGVVKVDTVRVLREVDSQGRLHLIDVISSDETDSVMAYLIDAQSIGIVHPGDFPGQIRESDDIVTSGRFSGRGPLGRLPLNNTKIRFFDGTQTTADTEIVQQTQVNNQFVGNGLAYVWSRFEFQEGRFNGDPSVSAVIRSRKCVDPRDVTNVNQDTFASLPKSFAINPYRFVFDYLIRPKDRGGRGVPISRIKVERFADAAEWGEGLVDTIQFSATAVFTQDSNKTLGTPPHRANHLLEFERSVSPFQYGDVIQFNVSQGQSLPGNVNTGQNYFVIPVRPFVNDFQFPAVAIANTLEDALAGNSIPIGTRTTNITVTKVKELRYQSAVTYRAEEDILPRLLESCGAKIFLDDGKISITSQRFPGDSDIESVDLDELIGPISLSPKINADDRATALSGTFTSLLNLFIPKSYPAVSGDGVFVDQDGESRVQVFDLPFVAKPSVAQRVAVVELRRRRQELTVAFSGDLSLFRLKPGTVFSLNFPKYGLDSETTFEVQNQTIAFQNNGENPNFIVDIEARQLESTTFDLSVGNEQFVESARIPGLESPFEVASPGTPQITEELFTTRTGAGVRSRVIVSWPASPSNFVVRYAISFKTSAATDFIRAGEVPASDTTFTINDLAPGTYDFQIEAINSAGRRSDPTGSEASGVEISGLLARPAAPTNFQGQVTGAANVLLRWDLSTDLDVREGGFVEIRHDSAITGAEAQNSVLLDKNVGGQTSLFVPFKRGTYFIRFEDSSGQFSNAASWSTQDRRPVDVAQDINFADIPSNGFTIQEDNAFPGQSDPGTTLEFDVDHLKLPLRNTLDTASDFDAIADVDAVGGDGEVAEEGFYIFNTDLEFTASNRVLVEAVLETEVFDLSTSIDDEPSFDQISNVDLVAAVQQEPGRVSAVIEVRFSSGTVASDTFGPWEPIDTQFINARSMQFRIRARSFVSTANIRINQARIRIRRVTL